MINTIIIITLNGYTLHQRINWRYECSKDDNGIFVPNAGVKAVGCVPIHISLLPIVTKVSMILTKGQTMTTILINIGLHLAYFYTAMTEIETPDFVLP